MSRRNYKHHSDYPWRIEREHHPRVSIGIFFIVLGISLLIATNDLFHLGSVSDYFTWQTAMIFIGILMLLNLNFTGGILLIAGGVWFLKDHIYFLTPEKFNTFYWPSVIALIGLAFIVSSLFNRKSNNNS
jgi:hypothetical protein